MRKLWYGVSHYLDYKTDVDVPAALRKDFQALSGLFYLADTHFEMFYDARQKSREDTEKLFDSPARASEQELNYDTLAALLRNRYPDRDQSETISELLNELNSLDYRTVASLEKVLDRSAEAFKRLEAVYPPGGGDRRYADVGVVRMSLAVADPEYRKYRKSIHPHSVEKFEQWEKYLKQEEIK